MAPPEVSLYSISRFKGKEMMDGRVGCVKTLLFWNDFSALIFYYPFIPSPLNSLSHTSVKEHHTFLTNIHFKFNCRLTHSSDERQLELGSIWLSWGRACVSGYLVVMLLWAKSTDQGPPGHLQLLPLPLPSPQPDIVPLYVFVHPKSPSS